MIITDREQEELQFLGFFGIFSESIKIIFSRRKIFTQITLSLILPLSFIFLSHIQFSDLLFSDTTNNNNNNKDNMDLDRTQKHAIYLPGRIFISLQWAAIWLFKAAFFIFLSILSLLSTSAVVYNIACIYTAKEISFTKVLAVVPKAWKRLVVTFLWTFAIFLDYNVVAGALFVVWGALTGFRIIGIAIFLLLFVAYLIGLVYIFIIWNLASVVSVLEDVYGFQALVKSRGLIKGKMGVAAACFFVLFICILGIEKVYDYLVFQGRVKFRDGVGSLCLFFLFVVSLFGLVVQTLIYFVCKSYHHEKIDKNSLADHLEGLLGEYVTPKAKDVPAGGDSCVAELVLNRYKMATFV